MSLIEKIKNIMKGETEENTTSTPESIKETKDKADRPLATPESYEGEGGGGEGGGGE